MLNRGSRFWGWRLAWGEGLQGQCRSPHGRRSGKLYLVIGRLIGATFSDVEALKGELKWHC